MSLSRGEFLLLIFALQRVFDETIEAKPTLEAPFVEFDYQLIPVGSGGNLRAEQALTQPPEMSCLPPLLCVQGVPGPPSLWLSRRNRTGFGFFLDRLAYVGLSVDGS